MNVTLTTINVAIGLIFVYLLMSLMCSVLQEFIANVTSWRGRHLRNGIKAMLNDPAMTGLAKRLYRHPRIASLTFPGKLPSYIPSTTFASALADIVVEDNNYRSGVDGPLAPFIKDAKDAGGKIEQLEAQFAKWFDDSMDGLGGWYKRNVQIVLFLLGLMLAAAFNVNSFEIARVLWTEPVLREAVVQSASKFYQEGGPAQPQSSPQEQFAKLQRDLDNLNLPFGWEPGSIACLLGKAPSDTTSPKGTASTICRRLQESRDSMARWWEWLVLLAGWLVTALATSLGTQFWFQTLGQALALRAAGARPPKATDIRPQADVRIQTTEN
ncbi:MAG TPA: hypothetical protein VKP67_20605 [Xanthobacteraceae bacterium]|nr:hypothetical protein [Xanthobacteraceae bacterium]